MPATLLKPLTKAMPYAISLFNRGRRAVPAADARPAWVRFPTRRALPSAWAPHAESVAVIGTFNGWDKTKHTLNSRERRGILVRRCGRARRATISLRAEDTVGELSKIDPYAREVTNSVGNGVVHDPSFDWGEECHKTPPWNEWVIYELHVGTFNDETPDDPKPGSSTASSSVSTT